MKSHNALEGFSFLLAIGIAAVLFGNLSYQACMNGIGWGSYPPNAPLAGFVITGMFLMAFYVVLVDAKFKTQVVVISVASLFAIAVFLLGF